MWSRTHTGRRVGAPRRLQICNPGRCAFPRWELSGKWTPWTNGYKEKKISLKIQQCRWNWPSPSKTQQPKLIQEETEHQHSPVSVKELDFLVKNLLIKKTLGLMVSLVKYNKCLGIVSKSTQSLPQHRKETEYRQPDQHCSNMETRQR